MKSNGIKSFTIYREYYELISLLDEKEQQELLLAITKYMFEDIEPVLNERQTKIFNNLKRPLIKSKEQSKRKTKKEPNDKPNENTSKMSMSMFNVNVNKNILEKEYEEKPFVDTDDTSSLAEISRKVIEHLNTKVNTNYRHNTKLTQKHINARLNEGYTLDDFIAVIDKKTKEWKETDMEKYLRPETLFGTKFENYLNQPNEINSSNEKPDWFDKEIKQEMATTAEVEEIDKILNIESEGDND